MAICVEAVRSIRWVASYPKSGNTWVRALLTNYLGSTNGPADINRLVGINASARDIFDNVAAVEASELASDEIDRYRPLVYSSMAKRSDPLFIKVHDAYAFNHNGEPLFPSDITFAVLYIVRNPLDVAVSWRHHSGVSLDTIVQRMCDDTWASDRRTDDLPPGLRATLRSWSGHVRSWVDESGLPLEVARYEDLAETPQATFARLVRAAGLLLEDSRLNRAVAFARFAELQRQESQSGFRERSPYPPAFFRRGVPGSWRDELSAAHVKRLTEAHSTMMERFGYLPS